MKLDHVRGRVKVDGVKKACETSRGRYRRISSAPPTTINIGRKISFHEQGMTAVEVVNREKGKKEEGGKSVRGTRNADLKKGEEDFLSL